MSVTERVQAPPGPTDPRRPGGTPAGEGPELLPLVIGVTGHRDLREEDREALEAGVAEVFREFRSRLPDTPLALLSPLAEGADQLVARVALRAGLRLIAPLPMDLADYETDFREPGTLDQFRDLLDRADPWFPLPPPAEGQDATREGAYARVGAYIAGHCQVLIALWDGVDNGKEGGTSQVVGFKLLGVPRRFAPARSPLDLPEAGPVYQLVAPRAGQPEPPGKLGRVVRYPGEGGAMGPVFDRIFGLMDAYNRDLLALPLAGERARSRSYMLPVDEAEALEPALRSDLGRYAAADALAQHFQRKTYRALVGLIGVVFVLASLFQAHVLLRQVYKLGAPGAAPWYSATLLVVDRASRVYLTTLDVAYLGFLGVAFALFQRARRGNYHNKYLDYRAIAEGLRVGFYWRLAGLGDSVADHYLRKQKGDLEWIRNAVRVGGIVGGPVPLGDPGGRLALVSERWVVDQERFFSRRAARAIGQSRWLRSLGNGSFYAGLAFLVLRAFAPPDHPLILSLAMALAVVLLINLYAKVLALAEHAKQYGRMSMLFAHASRQLGALLGDGKVGEARELLKDLGKESLAENGDWVLLHRERPLELPRV